MASRVARSRATALVERLLSIPPEPGPPAGTHESIRIFRAARGFYHYQLLRWAVKQAGAAIGLVSGFAFLSVIPNFPYRNLLDVLEYVGIATFLAALPFTYLLVHLDYQLRWYIVTDRSLRIREGLVHVSEKTMSFANIQNISVRQGPLQRLFGIADVEVRSAGGGAAKADHDESRADLHLGYFRGVDNAEEIRDAILLQVRQLRDSGLGDPDAAQAASGRAAPDAIAAARELLDEARALRLACQ